MKRLSLFLLIFFVVGYAALVVAQGPDVIVLEPRKGTITFTHLEHEKIIPDCGTCHHKGVEAGPCRGCHDGQKAPRFMRKAHFLCRECHKKSGLGSDCTFCHKK